VSGRLTDYAVDMDAIEFTTDLTESPVLAIPPDASARLPKSGRVRGLGMTEEDADDAACRSFAYEQFLRDDPPEDAIYDTLK
jgi:hypothetical protein